MPLVIIVSKLQFFSNLMTIRLVEFALLVIIASMDLNINVRMVHMLQ